MRYFSSYYHIEETDNIDFTDLRTIHAPFGDRAFALPYRRGWGGDEGENFAITLIVKDGTVNMATVQDYLDRAVDLWGIQDARQTRLEENTVENCFLNSSHERYRTCGFDEDQVKKTLNLTATCTFLFSSRNGMREDIIAALDEQQAAERTEATGYRESLEKELARIFDPVMAASVEGHAEETVEIARAPISYLIEGDTLADADEVAHILLGSLQQVGRLDSSHLFTVNIDEYSRWPLRGEDDNYGLYLNPQLIRAIEGNTLMVRYGALETGDSYNVKAYQLLITLLDLVEKNARDTQLILSVPEGKSDLVMRLRKRFNRPIVHLRKDVGTDLSNASFERNLKVMQDMAEMRGLQADELMEKLLLKRMRVSSATELETVFEEWVRYHQGSLAFPQYADIIEEAIDLEASDEQASALSRLDDLIGLESVKEHIRNILLRVEMGQKMLERGLPLQPFSMHMAFLGAPGTGKTEVARLYAEILKDKGVLSEGRLVTVSGGSGFNVEKAFEAARGSVLFVDEAYGMFGFENTVAEFIAQMENCRRDTVVILAGYEGHMNALLDSNPGFRSRVQTAIKFPDYTADELRRIFNYMAARQHLLLTPEAEDAVRDMVERAGHRADQGNARYIRRAFEDTVGAQQVRLAKRVKAGEGDSLSLDDLRTLTGEDVDVAVQALGGIQKKATVPARQELEELIGLDQIKKLVSVRMDFAKMQKVKRDAGMGAPFVPLHMAFKGNPGTGKTEVARLVGRILREEGVLSVGDFFECGRQDLVSSAVGETPSIVEALFQKARGSVIFIDEAYSLMDGGKGGPGTEAITTIVDQMEKLRDEVVVIFAGYTKEIDELLAQNPGFASRVKTHLEFPDYSTDELVEILHHMATKQGYVLAEGVDETVRGLVEKGRKDESFGNARFVRNLLENALVEQSVRLAASMSADGDADAIALTAEELSTLLPEDFTWNAPKGASRNAVGFVA